METPQPDRHYSRVSSLLNKANGMIDAGVLILLLVFGNPGACRRPPRE
jgi:hypothetical protein